MILITVVTTVTGIVGAIAGPVIFRLVGLSDERLQGLVLGINAHGIGTARAFDISSTCGALAGIAMALTGCISALLLPFLHSIWIH
jgi:putative effector of murein hydrolase